MLILQLVGHREGTRDRDLDGVFSVRPQKLDVAHLDRPAAGDRADHAGDGVWASGPTRGRPWMIDVKSVKSVRKAVRVALATHLAVGKDVKAESLLEVDGQQRRIVLRGLEPALLDPPELAHAQPRRRDLVESRAIDEPIGLGQAADDGRR